MNVSPVPEPHRILIDRPYWCVLIVLASVLLSFWAIYLDPVINSDGIGMVRAARYFSTNEWRLGLDVAGQPFYPMLMALLSRITGMSAAYSGYALSAGFHACLAVGFTALVGGLGGGRAAQGLAALVVLLYPALNEVRSYIVSDAAYWAFYVWSLAWFLHYAAEHRRRSLGMWVAMGLTALLFRLEASVFLIIAALWLRVRYTGIRRAWALKIPVVAAAAGVIVCYALWQQAWQSGAPAEQLLLHPVDHVIGTWHALGRAWRFKLEALGGEFFDRYSLEYDDAALLVTLLLMSGAALVKTLGLLYTALAAYALAGLKRVLSGERRYWWGIFTSLSLVLLLVPAFTEFAADKRVTMTAALTILAIVPLLLERVWRTRIEGCGRRPWVFPVILLLVLGSGFKGLDLRTAQYHLRQAGSWLRANVASGSSLYTNNRIVVYYSGLEGYRSGADYSWRHAMNMVHRDQWRDYDYLALEIKKANRHREGILMRNLELKPSRIFTNDLGDRVLLFKTKR